MINIENATLSELEKEQERLHDEFERCKSECYDMYLKMEKLSSIYQKIDERISKMRGE